MAAVLLSLKGSLEGVAASSPIVALGDMGGHREVEAPGPSFEEEVGAGLCPLTGAVQGVVTSPCWSVEQSLTLHEPFLWRHGGVGNLVRNMRGEGWPGPGLGGGVKDAGPLTPPPGTPCMMPRAPPTHWLW